MVSAAACLWITQSAQAQVLQKLSDSTRGMSIELPSSWYAAGQELARARANTGLDGINAKDEITRKRIEASVKRSGFIFSVYQHAPGTPNQRDVSVFVIEENIATSPGIKDGCDYNTHVQKVIALNPSLKITSALCKKRVINGKEFGTFEVEKRVGDEISQQIYGAIRVGDNAIGFIQTYHDGSTKSETTRIVASLRFTK